MGATATAMDEITAALPPAKANYVVLSSASVDSILDCDHRLATIKPRDPQ